MEAASGEILGSVEHSLCPSTMVNREDSIAGSLITEDKERQKNCRKMVSEKRLLPILQQFL